MAEGPAATGVSNIGQSLSAFVENPYVAPFGSGFQYYWTGTPMGQKRLGAFEFAGSLSK
jgi:hypothetical protein